VARHAGAGERFGIPEWFALLALGSFLAARFLPVLGMGGTCPFLAVTGLPCATCGMTHAFVALARGQAGAAWGASPLGALLAGAAWAYATLDLLRVALGRPWPAISPGAWRTAILAGMGAVVVNWAWMLWQARGA
jgi:hypothetical protein